eukprot:9048966-Alexandrium_andersonii.AAC.1
MRPWRQKNPTASPTKGLTERASNRERGASRAGRPRATRTGSCPRWSWIEGPAPPFAGLAGC